VSEVTLADQRLDSIDYV
jgi:hypothetical protein